MPITIPLHIFCLEFPFSLNNGQTNQEWVSNIVCISPGPVKFIFVEGCPTHGHILKHYVHISQHKAYTEP